MVCKCCVPGCKSEWTPNSVLSFHMFPKDPSLHKLWTVAVGKERLPVAAHICSIHFNQEDFELHTRIRKLKRTAMPVYSLPNSTVRPPRTRLSVPLLCISKGTERYLEIPTLKLELPEEHTNKKIKQKLPPSNESRHKDPLFIEDGPVDASEITSEHNYFDKCEQEEENYGQSRSPSSPRADFFETNTPLESPNQSPVASPVSNYRHKHSGTLKTRIDFLQRKVRILQAKLRRKNTKQEKMFKQLTVAKNYTRLSEIENILSGNFRKLCAALNNNGVSVNYSDEVIKFAITLNYYSPKVYNFIKKYIPLPTTRMLERYASCGTYIINLDDSM